MGDSYHEGARQSHRNTPNIGGLYRSSSFSATRGTSEFSSSVGGAYCPRSSTPVTPEIKKRPLTFYNLNYVSPYSRRVIDAERKSQSHAGIQLARERDSNFCSPQISRRTSLPPSITTSFGPLPSSSHCPGKVAMKEITPEEGEEADDNISEKSFGSVCSAQSCDLGKEGMSNKGLSGCRSHDRRSRNIVHCSHSHSHDPDDYLTPTQRAARKIRELEANLKKARREIQERDCKISALTRDLVELRMTKAGDGSNDIEKSTKIVQEIEKHQKRNVKRLPGHMVRGSPPPSCVTPTSEGSEHELHMLTRRGNLKEDEDQAETTSDKGAIGESCLRDSPAAASVSDSGDLSRSLADSGHYEDLPSPCLSSRLSQDEDTLDVGIPSLRKVIGSICSSEGERDSAFVWEAVRAAEEGIRAEWSRRIEELKANHMEEYHEMKERHNDKVEMLLSKLSESNLKYFELRPQYDKAQEKILRLEKEIARLEDDLRENEIRHQKVYLQMYLKGQQAARLEEDDKLYNGGESSSHSKECKKSKYQESSNMDGKSQSSMVLSLMKQLAESEDEIEKLKMLQSQDANRNGRRSAKTHGNRREEIDPEITLQFLKSAIYYFLTDKENAQGHLRAIESILGYSSAEKGKINTHFRI